MHTSILTWTLLATYARTSAAVCAMRPQDWQFASNKQPGVLSRIFSLNAAYISELYNLQALEYSQQYIYHVFVYAK
jgi:hypothetical protein